jgi:hypothetical protein
LPSSFKFVSLFSNTIFKISIRIAVTNIYLIVTFPIL